MIFCACVIVFCMYHRVLDPPGGSHQFLNPSIDDVLVFRGEYAPLVCGARSCPSLPAVFIGSQFGVIIGTIFPGFWAFFCGPQGDSFPHKQFEGQLLKEIFDDMHHIWADIPDDIEMAQVHERAECIHAAVRSWVACIGARPCIARFALVNGLRVGSGFWWPTIPRLLKVVIPPESMVWR